MVNETEGQEFSLADLADLDVSEIEEIRFEQLPAGIFGFKTVSSELGEATNKDGEKYYYWEGKFEVLEVTSLLEPNADPDKVMGKVHTERKTIDPSDAETGIGRIRAFITDLGFDSAGKLGPVVEQIKDHEFRAKIVKRKNKDDPSIEYANIQLERNNK